MTKSGTHSGASLKIIPLGCTGTFGMNCTVLQYGDSISVIDVGMKIPQGNFPGVDLFYPDITYILENSEKIEVTHINLNDESVEGIHVSGKNAFSVQYHPEANPGPHDARYLFDQFLEMIKKSKSESIIKV